MTEAATPVLGRTGVPDLHIDSLSFEIAGKRRYLQTSPEYFMKRLLASGSGAIFQIGPVFRANESGRHHNTEFLMLEWYRPGWSLDELAGETRELLDVVFEATGREPLAVRNATYRELFEARYGINPHEVETKMLQQLAHAEFPDSVTHILPMNDDGTRNDYLDTLFSCGIEPSLTGVTFVFDFPATQSALARTARTREGDLVAKRFECFTDGLEIANAYDELTDASELRRRFEQHNRMREVRGKPTVPLDEKLLAATDAMPASAGIALGIDRLVQRIAGVTSLDAVLHFDDRHL